MLWFLVVGITAGWLAGTIMKGRGFGLIGDLVVGVIGSFIGGFLFTTLNLGTYGKIGEIVMATIGAIILLWGYRSEVPYPNITITHDQNEK